MITNFKECVIEAINELHDLNMDVVVNNDIPYYECFPAYIMKIINIDGKDYGMSIDINLEEL